MADSTIRKFRIIGKEIKFQIIRTLDWFDAHILEHRVYWLCQWIGNNDWWGDVFIQYHANGLPTIGSTNIAVKDIGLAHESGASDVQIMSTFNISRHQFKAAINYFRQNRDEAIEGLKTFDTMEEMIDDLFDDTG